MDLPKGKKRPKLPPKPVGGGAAARQHQFQLERGLKPGELAAHDPAIGGADETLPKSKAKKSIPRRRPDGGVVDLHRARGG
jgi:hypothetical protein